MSFPSSITLPDAIFWDWDGTIVDSYEYLNDAHNYTLTTLGFPKFKDGEFRDYFGRPRDILYAQIYKHKMEEAKDIFQTYVFENAHKIKPLPGCDAALDLLTSRGITMGIVSNKKASFIEEELKHTGFKKHFPTVIGAGEAHSDKPSGAPLMLAMERHNLANQDKIIWYVGDTENDLSCAQEAGCPALFLKGAKNTEELIERYNPLLSFDNYSQFREFLVAL